MTPDAGQRSEDVGISLVGVSKAFGRGDRRTAALCDIDLDIAPGSFVSVIGPSGCGKSTLLRLVAGLLTPDSGTIRVLDTSPLQACRDKLIGLVPQSPALLPWRSVLDNVRLPFQVNRAGGRRSSAHRVEGATLDPAEVLAAVGLGEALEKRPAELSGGMQQRVAVARAFAFGAPVLLMDEPFSALDELTRESVRHRLLDLWQAHRKTVLFVTHSVAEAVALSDRVIVMSSRPGRIIADITIGIARPRGPAVELSEEFHDAETQVRLALRKGWADAA
ncbi:ABC transporter ATP-binding protein [Acidiferrimicrobium sp. IK]|uniref:ABC transporter ATP-binding protein n=1 Tax=Acidiferrimicrobium sp. IK TaxID=2871700 RepID=UPI0021CAED5C|nr:ABC transporter ATP-binding protein [Acidiferrimicrobium sp. IK]MCU4183734.1 ABC transporter ATP-binding protein [Acidiferrimicrobium sp. IK]